MDSDNGVEGQRIASSMSDHVQLLLDLNQKNLDGQMDGTPMSEHQVAILKLALAAGGRVSRADYEQAWASYRQCIVNKGYAAPPVMKVGEFYQAQWSMASVEGQEAREEKLREDDMACGKSEMLNVNEVYQRQHSNPNLYRNPSEGVDCLHRNNLANNHEAMDIQEYKSPEWRPFG